jgi:RNA polymerase sigma-70 factor, ECF subfamily
VRATPGPFHISENFRETLAGAGKYSQAVHDSGVKYGTLTGLSRRPSLDFFAFDDVYLERLRSGDFRTEQHFVSYFSELIRLKLRSRVPSTEIVDELKQEIFVRVFSTLRSAAGIRQASRLGAFVNSVCNNVLLEHYRSSSRTTPLQEDEDAPEIPDSKVDILGTVMSKQIAGRVRSVLETLSERDRRLLKEIFLEERDKDAVCRDFQVDRGYLRVLLHRAKQTFKSQFLKEEAGASARSGSE